jgi:hypothetical protein
MTFEILMQGGGLAVAAYAAIALGRIAPSLVKLATAASVWFAGQESLRVATLSHFEQAAKWEAAEQERHEALLAAFSRQAMHVSA